MKNLLLLIIIQLISISTAFADIVDHFNEAAPTYKNWQAWGQAKISFDENTKSVSFSSEDGSEAVLYRKFSNIKGPFTQIKISLKAERLGLNRDGEGFTLYFKTKGMEVTPVKVDFKGSFDWSEVSFSVPVVSSELELWFKLKSSGRVWLDNFVLKDSLKKSSGLIFNQNNNTIRTSQKYELANDCYADIEGRTLVFKSEEIGFPSKMISQKYYDVDLGKFKIPSLKSYEFLEFEINVESSLATKVPFYFAIVDEESKNYWGQLNHSQTLVAGVNKVTLELKREVGERGSQQVKREIDFNRLKKIYLVLDPDKKVAESVSANISRVSFTRITRPAAFKGLYAFDFTDSADKAAECFAPVTLLNIKSSRDEYGFLNLEGSKVHDSIYSDNLNRRSIEVSKGIFEINLPNGDYEFAFNWNKLGYWDTPFWKRRLLEVQGQPILLETRSDAKDYLKEYLRFEKTEPTLQDHPWDLYLKQMMIPVEHSFKVTQGKLTLAFEGDASAVNLNSLIIWPKNLREKALKFRKELETRQRQQFEKIAHLQTYRILKRKNETVLFEGLPRLNAWEDFSKHKIEKEIKEVLFKEDLLTRSLAIYSNEEGPIEFQVSPQIAGLEIEVYRAVHQFVSFDRNHQTYMLGPNILRPLDKFKGKVRAEVNEQFFVTFKTTKNFKAGKYQGEIVIKKGKELERLPLNLTLVAEKLPVVDFPVGFLGLQSVEFNYFEAPMVSKFRLKFVDAALAELGTRGFTTWSGLPSTRSPTGFDATEFQKQLALSVSHGIDGTVFSYSGKFPYEYFNQGEKEILRYQDEITGLFKAAKPQIVFSFSDEAFGYSDSVDRDIKRAVFLKKNFPQIQLGGFSHVDSKGKSFALNKFFNFGSYSNYIATEMTKLKAQGQSWGLYNQASAPVDNPRLTFSVGLFWAREYGLTHYLEWHLSGVHNYPYYDLDGRENDAMMLYPTQDGDLLSTVKFEQASMGLRDYRLLKMLEKRKSPYFLRLKSMLKEQKPTAEFMQKLETFESTSRELRKEIYSNY